MVDTHKRLFGDWCELNFKEGVPEPALTDLQLDDAEIDAVQEAGSAKVAAAVGLQDPRALTFIPSVIVEYPGFWRRLLTQGRFLSAVRLFCTKSAIFMDVWGTSQVICPI